MTKLAVPKSLLALSVFLTLSCPLIAPSEARADSVVATAPEKFITPPYRPDLNSFKPPLGTYDYVVSWQGIPAADASISVSQEGMRYRLVATARTYSGIDLFYKLRYRAEGLMSAIDLSPIKTIIDQRENSTFRNFQIEFLEDGSIRAVRSKNGKDAAVVNLNTENATLDPFSAAFLARSFSWEKGQTRNLDTFNGKTRYDISLTAEDQSTVYVNGEPRSVWVIVPKVRIVDSVQQNKKLRDARIYITADERREVLKIVSSVFIGSVTTSLDAFTPSSAGSLTHVAERERILLK